MPTCHSQVPDKRIHNFGSCSKQSPICHNDIPPIDRGFHLLVEWEYVLNKTKLEIYTWFIYQNVINDLDVIWYGSMLQIIYTMGFRVKRLKNVTLRLFNRLTRKTAVYITYITMYFIYVSIKQVLLKHIYI